MRFKCHCCKAKLSRPYESFSIDADYIISPWYVDRSHLKHLLMVCLNCGALHDCTGSMGAALISAFRGNPLKMEKSITPLELGQYILSMYGTDSPRAVLKSDFNIPEWIIDTLVERKLLGKSYAES